MHSSTTGLAIATWTGNTTRMLRHENDTRSPRGSARMAGQVRDAVTGALHRMQERGVERFVDHLAQVVQVAAQGVESAGCCPQISRSISGGSPRASDSRIRMVSRRRPIGDSCSSVPARVTRSDAGSSTRSATFGTSDPPGGVRDGSAHAAAPPAPGSRTAWSGNRRRPTTGQSASRRGCLVRSASAPAWTCAPRCAGACRPRCRQASGRAR